MLTVWLENTELFKQKALQWASLHNTACYLDSNGYADPYSAFDVLIAADSKAAFSAASGNAFKALQTFINENPEWALGFFSYDLKNELEKLRSQNHDNLHFPDIFFFVPKDLLLIKGNEVSIISETPEKVLEAVKNQELYPREIGFKGNIIPRIDQAAYIEKIEKIKQHIIRGDIYEVNFCQEFYAENVHIDPVAAFSELNSISPTPFAGFFKQNRQYIICASPERYLSKRKNKLISQPIKGTAGRKSDEREDFEARSGLRSNLKEQAENVMIVDLVRNDLTKCAVPGTVRVEELFGIYSFKQVHQMISTVVCQADPTLPLTDLIKNAFPMGSMTGAPKIKAMELIENYESSRRGIYSGSIGYISPDMDFDFNVVIRSLLYNEETAYLSFHTGSAITFDSDPAKEYEECLLKAQAIIEALHTKKAITA